MELEEQPVVRRRRHSEEFKAELIAACRPGVSVASVAMAKQINPNLLRRWLKETEGRRGNAVSKVRSPNVEFVQLPMAQNSAQAASVRIELQRGAVTVRVDWPLTAIAASSAWLRDVLK